MNLEGRKNRIHGRQLLEMLLVMGKISCFTFGGGWSILAQMQKEFCDKRGWVTQEELMDFASVGRSLPGIMIMNITTLFGYTMAGVGGALAALVGLTLPPLLVMCGVAYFYTAIKSNVWIAKALIGIRAAIVPVLLEAAVKLVKSAVVDWISLGITIGAALLCVFTPVNNSLLVAAGIVLGLLVRRGNRDAVS